MSGRFDKHGGFRRLHSFTLATIVQLETLSFCRRFLTYKAHEGATRFYDPQGRQYDQMTQAARSGPWELRDCGNGEWASCYDVFGGFWGGFAGGRVGTPRRGVRAVSRPCGTQRRKKMF